MLLDVVMGSMALLLLAGGINAVYRAGILPLHNGVSRLWNQATVRYFHSSVSQRFIGPVQLVECGSSSFVLQDETLTRYTIEYYQNRLAIKKGSGRNYLSDVGDISSFKVDCSGSLVSVTITAFQDSMQWWFGVAYD